MATQTIKLRLLRRGENFTIENAMKEGHTLHAVDWQGIEGGQLFVGRVYMNPPPWLSFLSGGQNALPQDLLNSGSAAVLFVPVEERIIAVCFGHAHLVLNTHHFERNFGLLVTLNKVERHRLRSLDSATPDAVTFQRRVQASKDSDLAHFGIDYDRDLVTLAAGTPSDSNFAKFLAGKDSLSITCELTAASIHNKCREALTAFSATDYRTHYKWIDHVQPVKEADIITRLDIELMAAIDELRQGGANDLHLAPPEIVDYTEGCELRFNGLTERGLIFDCLSIENYISELERCRFAGGIEELKSQRISAKTGDSGSFSEKWKTYDCFVFETEVDGAKYVLFAGEWFRIDTDFAAEIERFFAGLERVALIPSTDKPNEQKLIEHLEGSRADFVKLDCVKINPRGTRYANLEPCDFLSDQKQFIHIKDGHSSGPISHLWMQGVVSAEAFLSDRDFRIKLRRVVKGVNEDFTQYLPTRSARPVPAEYKIIYAIMRRPYSSRQIGLPFFSKVSLRTAVHRLETLGFPVAINLIEKTGSAAGNGEEDD